MKKATADPRGTRSGADGDLDLVRRAARGEVQARRELGARLECVQRFLAARNRHCGGRLGRDELKDLAQDVLLEVWRQLERFEGRSTIETWVYRFCHFALVRRLSRGRERDRRQRDAQDRYALDRRERELSGLEETPASDELAQLLRHLTPREALVARRRHVEQLEFQEIAVELGISVSSAKTYYYRGVDKLRALINPALESQP